MITIPVSADGNGEWSLNPHLPADRNLEGVEACIQSGEITKDLRLQLSTLVAATFSQGCHRRAIHGTGHSGAAPRPASDRDRSGRVLSQSAAARPCNPLKSATALAR